MQLRPAAAALMFLVSWAQFSKVGHAAVIVLANRTPQEVRFSIAPAEGKSRPYKLAKGEVKALPLQAGDDLVFVSGKTQQRCHVRLNEIYYFLGDAAQAADHSGRLQRRLEPVAATRTAITGGA